MSFTTTKKKGREGRREFEWTLWKALSECLSIKERMFELWAPGHPTQPLTFLCFYWKNSTMGVCDVGSQEARFDFTSLLQDWLWEEWVYSGHPTGQLFLSLIIECSGGGGGSSTLRVGLYGKLVPWCSLVKGEECREGWEESWVGNETAASD